MKQILFLFFLTIGFVSISQNHRYVESIFSDVDITTDVVYGTAEFLNSPYYDESATTTGNLVMDIYQPLGDTHTNRPAIIFAHGGGFAEGNRTVDDMVAFCDTFARKGYVTATIDYRQGVEVADNPDLHYTRAAYRGIQDGRQAVRFLRANASTYGIDPNKIYWGGNSAGSFIGLNSIYVDGSEKPTDANAVSYSIGVVPYTGPNLGGLDIGDNLTFEGDPDAVMACWGGIGDTLNINPNNSQNVFLVHGTADDIVPFNSGAPFNLSGVSDVFGSNSINTRLTNVGMPVQMTYFVDGEPHEFYGVTNGNWTNGTNGNAHWDVVVQKATEFYWKQHKPTASFEYSAIDLTVDFTDLSTNATSWFWDFDDGNTSLEQNPSHTFASTGQYDVTLYIENDDFSWDEITETVFVSNTPMNGTYSIGWGANDDYQTFYQALNDLQLNGINGPVILEISPDYDPNPESYPVFIQNISGSDATNTLTIKPAEDVDFTFDTETASAMSAVFIAWDASNIIIDGSNNGTDSKNLTIINSAELDETAAIGFLHHENGGENITVKNCIFKAHSNSYDNVGIYCNGYTDVTIQNNEITNANIGVLIDSCMNTTVTENIVGSDNEEDYVNQGIGFMNSENFTVSKNIVKNLISDIEDNVHGIYSMFGEGNIEIMNNKIQNVINQSSTNVAQGIALYYVDANYIKVVNNHIAGIASDSYEDNFPAGIAVLCPDMTSGIKINYNSIYLNENNDYGLGNGGVDALVAGVTIGGGTGIVMKNNIIYNGLGERDGSSESTYGLAVLTNQEPSPFTQIDNNIYYVDGDYDYAFLAMNQNGPQNLADWQTWTGQDANSFFQAPLFVSETDLTLQQCSPAITNGTVMNGVTTDINDSTRNSTNPTIGAYEYQMVQAYNLFQLIPIKTEGSVWLEWQGGNGCKVAIFMKEGDFISEPPQPENGMTYTASTTFGEGEQIETTGWYCVYNEESYEYNNANFYGTEGVDYTIMACEYWGEEGDEYYLTEISDNNPILTLCGNFNISEIDN